MKQILGLMFQNVIGQAVKTRITVIIPLMKTSGGIMRNEDINGREG